MPLESLWPIDALTVAQSKFAQGARCIVETLAICTLSDFTLFHVMVNQENLDCAGHMIEIFYQRLGGVCFGGAQISAFSI